jgi:hypothetical protein
MGRNRDTNSPYQAILSLKQGSLDAVNLTPQGGTSRARPITVTGASPVGSLLSSAVEIPARPHSDAGAVGFVAGEELVAYAGTFGVETDVREPLGTRSQNSRLGDVGNLARLRD